MSDLKGPGMIQRGEVRGVRELTRGVQAQVCLGATVIRGSAVVTIDSASPRVMQALKDLKEALRADAYALVNEIVHSPERIA